MHFTFHCIISFSLRMNLDFWICAPAVITQLVCHCLLLVRVVYMWLTHRKPEKEVALRCWRYFYPLLFPVTIYCVHPALGATTARCWQRLPRQWCSATTMCRKVKSCPVIARVWSLIVSPASVSGLGLGEQYRTEVKEGWGGGRGINRNGWHSLASSCDRKCVDEVAVRDLCF